MILPDQRFHCTNVSGLAGHIRLIVQDQFIAVNCLVQLRLKRQPVRAVLIKILGVQCIARLVLLGDIRCRIFSPCMSWRSASQQSIEYLSTVL